jgi:peptide/nickel transport system ATP-binding protein/oligopeptide transport system ATP-binding protein
LTVSVRRDSERFHAVEDVSFDIEAGSAFGIVGESGSGKSLTLRAIMALLPAGAHVESGSVLLDGVTLDSKGRSARAQRRARVAMVFQDPLSALNPVRRIGEQVAEVPHRVLGRSRAASRQRALELLGLVGIPEPARRADAYPHELSGGMRQRVAIAMALASEPTILLCDEPTTALDVTVQAQVLDLIDKLRVELDLAVAFVSHDLGVVRELCGTVAVMYAGRLVEIGSTAALLPAPRHPYTLGLLRAVVDLDDPIGVLRPIGGTLPDPLHLPRGCAFHPRCPLASEECRASVPPLVRVDTTEASPRLSACFHADQVETP